MYTCYTVNPVDHLDTPKHLSSSGSSTSCRKCRRSSSGSSAPALQHCRRAHRSTWILQAARSGLLFLCLEEARTSKPSTQRA